MRLPRLSARDRRALVAGAILLAPALAFHSGVRPYLAALRDIRGQIDRERGLLGRERALLREVRDYPTRFAGAEAALLEEAPRLFGGPDLGAAAAALANHVGAAAAAHRVFIQESETRPPQAAGDGIAKVTVQLRAMGDLEGILAFFRSLETGPKLLTIERVTIGQAERLNRDPSRDEEILGLVATVSGYALEEIR